MTNILKKLIPVFLLIPAMSFVAFAADQVQIRSDAPAQYEVVEGDTLWDISGRFLEDAWLWPEVWELNPQIENPHLIYPGDVIALEYSADGPLLTLRRGGAGSSDSAGLRTVRLSPQIRTQSLNNAIPAIPLDKISAFLSGNIILPQSDFESSPYVLGNRNQTLFSIDNDEVFAKGNWTDDVIQYDIIRGGKVYRDPVTNAVIGLEGKRIGRASLQERNDDNATLVLSDLLEEVRKGDRFIPGSGNRIDSNYFPRPPSFAIDGRIIDIVSGRTVGNLYDSIVINKGRSDRLRVGDLLALQKPDITFEDTIGELGLGEQFKQAVGLSSENVETFSGAKYATVLVYRVFEDASLGIILSAEEAIRLEDKIVTP